MNKFKNDQNILPPSFKIDDSIRQVQMDKLVLLKEKRDAAKVALCLNVIKDKAINGENLMPAVINGVENHCTLGEISNILRDVFGEYN